MKRLTPHSSTDPLEQPQLARSSADIQSNGILLLENDDDTEEEIESKPPLPPRPQEVTREASPPEELPPLKRKPAPPLEIPPRYSIVMGRHHFPNNVPLEDDSDHDQTEDVHNLPAYSMAHSEPPIPSPSTSPTPAIPRKPLPKTDNNV